MDTDSRERTTQSRFLCGRSSEGVYTTVLSIQHKLDAAKRQTGVLLRLCICHQADDSHTGNDKGKLLNNKKHN